MYNVLLIEDDVKLRSTVTDYLSINDFMVNAFDNGNDGLEYFYKNSKNIDIILLDLMLPNISGYNVLENVRKVSDIPVIIMSAKESEMDQLKGFKLGADNYLTKPFLLSIMKEHIMALLNRVNGQDEVLKICNLEMNKTTRVLKFKGDTMETTPKEFDLLYFLSKNKEKVYTRDQILNAVWGLDYDGDDRTVDTIVKQLRKKMGDDGKHIISIYGVGYKFSELR